MGNKRGAILAQAVAPAADLSRSFLFIIINFSHLAGVPGNPCLNNAFIETMGSDLLIDI